MTELSTETTGRWVTALEDDRRRELALEGNRPEEPGFRLLARTSEIDLRPTAHMERAHAYDVIERKLPHPLGRTYTVLKDRPWAAEASFPRCLHCLEIVGGDTSPSAPNNSRIDEADKWLSELE